MEISQYALTDLDEVKTFLQIEDDLQNDLIITLINTISDAVERWCGRYFINREIEQEPHDCDSLSLDLCYYPVNSVTEIMCEGKTLNKDKCRLIKSAGILEYPRGFKGAVLVSYNAGYGNTKNDVPPSVKLAALKWIAGVLQTRTSSVATEHLGDYWVHYYEPGNDIPLDVRALLEPFRARCV